MADKLSLVVSSRVFMGRGRKKRENFDGGDGIFAGCWGLGINLFFSEL